MGPALMKHSAQQGEGNGMVVKGAGRNSSPPIHTILGNEGPVVTEHLL